MFPLFFLAGLYWIAASVWIHLTGDATLVWVSLLPTVWLGTLCLYKG